MHLFSVCHGRPSPAKGPGPSPAGRRKGESLIPEIQEQSANEELIRAHRATHNAVQSVSSYVLSTYYGLGRGPRDKGYRGKEGNQEFSLELPTEPEDIYPHPLSPKEATHAPKLPHFEVQIFLTVKGGTGL